MHLHLQMEISPNHSHRLTSAQTRFRLSAVISGFYNQPPNKLHSICTRTSIHIQCHLKQEPQYWMLCSPALVREYPPFYSNLVIRTKTISQAYTMKWYVSSSALTVGSKTLAMFVSFGLIAMQRLTPWEYCLALVKCNRLLLLGFPTMFYS